MRCHVCNVAVGDGQRFCHECGESLTGVTDPTELIDAVDGPAVDPADALTVERDARTAAVSTDEDELLSSEQVDPPEIDEPAVPRAHRGALPDVATDDGPDPADDVGETASESEDAASPDESGWWADGPPPAAASPFASAAAPSAASTATEAMDLVVASPASAGGLASIPDEIYSPSAPAYEPTTVLDALGTAPGRLHDTDELPVAGAPIFDGVDDVDEYTVPPSEGFRLRASFVFAFLAVVATLMASVADVIDIRTSRPVDGISVGIRAMEDFGTNLPVAGFIGAAVMLIGGLLSCFGLRSGAGIAGGAGLALTGWSAMTIGLVEVPIHSAEGITRNTPTDVNGFTLAVTRDLGWFLIAAVGVIGLIVFLTSLRMAGTGGRRGLNPWIAALGAVGAVILAAGPLIPLGEATADLNLGFVGLPRAFFAGRLVQLSMIAVCGIVGFLSVRTYGLGLAAGGLGVAAWLWATSLADYGDQPVGVAVGNIGTTDTTPHAVTSVGLAVTLVMLAVATTMAILNRPRR